MSQVHPVLRKTLALTLLAAALALVWLGLLQPLKEQYEAYDESIARSERLLERYARIGARSERLAVLLAKVKARGSATRGMLTGESVELAGAEMQERLKRIVETSGGRLNSSQMLAVEETDAARRLGVRVAMTGDIETLQRALYDFETAEPYFFVDRLDIQASRAALRTARKRAPRRKSDPTQMQVRFDLYAYLPAAE